MLAFKEPCPLAPAQGDCARHQHHCPGLGHGGKLYSVYRKVDHAGKLTAAHDNRADSAEVEPYMTNGAGADRAIQVDVINSKGIAVGIEGVGGEGRCQTSIDDVKRDIGNCR